MCKLVTFASTTSLLAEDYLPFLILGNTPGVQKINLPPEDDGSSEPIYIPGGMPAGSEIHSRAYVRYQ